MHRPSPLRTELEGEPSKPPKCRHCQKEGCSVRAHLVQRVKLIGDAGDGRTNDGEIKCDKEDAKTDGEASHADLQNTRLSIVLRVLQLLKGFYPSESPQAQSCRSEVLLVDSVTSPTPLFNTV